LNKSDNKGLVDPNFDMSKSFKNPNITNQVPFNQNQLHSQIQNQAFNQLQNANQFQNIPNLQNVPISVKK